MRGNSESINKPLYLMVWVREGADTWRPDTIHRRRRRLAFGLCRAKHEVRSEAKAAGGRTYAVRIPACGWKIWWSTMVR